MTSDSRQFLKSLTGGLEKMAIFRHILDIFLLSATFHKGTILDDAFSFSLQIVLSFAVKGEFKNSISHILCRHIWDTGRHCIAKIVLESRNIQFYNKINKSCLSSSSKNAQVFSPFQCKRREVIVPQMSISKLTGFYRLCIFQI